MHAPFIEYLLIAAIVVYIVDLSGFTQSWKGLISAKFGGRCKVGKPFDCSLCMTWWVCLVYAFCMGRISLGTIAFSALLSHLSNPISSALIFIREWITWIFDKLMPE